MSVSLDQIIKAIEEQGLLVEKKGALPGEVTLVTDDSRQVRPGALFVAVKGADRDGHAYLAKAAESGATAAIVEQGASTKLPSIVVKSGRQAAAIAGATAVDWPAREMQLVAVTGTNG